MDNFLTDILGLFVESHIADLGDIIDDIHLLLNEEDTSSVVTREYSDPLVRSLHDLYYQVDMIADPYVQKLQEVSLSFEETIGSSGYVLHPSFLEMHSFFSAILEGVTISINTWTIE